MNIAFYYGVTATQKQTGVLSFMVGLCPSSEVSAVIFFVLSDKLQHCSFVFYEEKCWYQAWLNERKMQK